MCHFSTALEGWAETTKRERFILFFSLPPPFPSIMRVTRSHQTNLLTPACCLVLEFSTLLYSCRFSTLHLSFLTALYSRQDVAGSVVHVFLTEPGRSAPAATDVLVFFSCYGGFAVSLSPLILLHFLYIFLLTILNFFYWLEVNFYI